MKLRCNVKVRNRMLDGELKKRSQRSQLLIGKEPGDSGLYIILQTLDNVNGSKYKVNDNIEQVFTKFADDGKATIRLKEPCLDLIIQANAIELKSFLNVMKLGLSKKVELPVIPAKTNFKNISLKPSGKKVVLRENFKYPVLKGFPRETEELYLIGLNRKSFDRQILKLNNLQILNLSSNQITSLPKDLGFLPRLKELDVSKNNLGKCDSKWLWLDQPGIKYSLCTLDLSCNQLTVLPDQIGKLQNLVYFKVSENKLTKIPQSIGSLYNLKYFEVSYNSLAYLPGSIRNIKLSYFDISHNPFLYHGVDYEFNLGVPSLVECSARRILKSRKTYDSSLIPSVMVTYLDKAKYCCICRNPCLDCYVKKYVKIDLHSICTEIKITQRSVKFECYFCSANCSLAHLPTC